MIQYMKMEIKMNSHKHRPVLVVLHASNPVKGSKTHIKGWQSKGFVNMDERAIIVPMSKMKKSWLAEASVIIDLLSRKAIKNRFEHDKNLISHYYETYTKDIAIAVASFMVQHGNVPENKPAKITE